MPPNSEQPTDQRGAWGFMAVFFGSLAQILIQFVLQVLLARFFGTSRDLDAYVAAMILPVTVSSTIAGTLGPALISRLHHLQPGDERRTFVGMLLGLTVTGTFAFALLASLLAEVWVRFYVADFPVESQQLTQRLFLILIWLVPANTLIGILQALLHHSLNYRIPAFAGVAGPATTVLLVVLLHANWGIFAVAIGTLTGAGLNVLIQLPAVRELTRLTWDSSLCPEFSRLWLVAVPILFGMAASRVDLLIDPYVAAQLEAGSLARLRYATQLVMIFVILSSGTVSTLAYPKLALAASRSSPEFLHEFTATLRLLILLILPSLLVLGIFGEALVKDLFQRGSFTAEDSQRVARLLLGLTGFLLGASLGEICSKALYSTGDTRTPAWIGSSCVVIGAACKLTLVPHLGLTGLVLITSLVYLLGSVLMIGTLGRRFGWSFLRPLLLPFRNATLAASGAILTGWCLLQSTLPLPAFTGLLLGGSLYLLLLRTLDLQLRTDLQLRSQNQQ